MGTREVSPPQWSGESTEAFQLLRSRWRTASLASGWSFPGDWSIPEVDFVCTTIMNEGSTTAALARLGRARAETGCGLGETLQDVAALHAVLTAPENLDGLIMADPDALPSKLLRVTALAWADVLIRQLGKMETCDALTGLASAGYLRARLREIYREATVENWSVHRRHVLVVVSLDLNDDIGWSRLAAMTLLADVLRAAFDGGQTLAALGPSTLVALAERDERLSPRMAVVSWLAADRFGVDPQLRTIRPPAVWLERLPSTAEAACRLLTTLTPACRPLS